MKQRHIIPIVIFFLLAFGITFLWFSGITLFGQTSDSATTTTELPESLSRSGVEAAWLVAGECFALEVANTHERRRRGLGGRVTLAPRTGMLFTYDIPGEYGFWMKSMNFSIDIIWLNSRDEIITIATNVSPDSYPQVFYPVGNAKKVIEVSAGTADRLSLKVGDELRLSSPTTTTPVSCAIF